MTLTSEWVEWALWDRVTKTETCWIWNGYVDRRGYGRLNRDGRAVKAHRLAFEATFGPIEPDMFVCHHCDNPPCVRPDHLFAGTAKDNMLDMSRKERGKTRRMTAEQVREALRALDEGETFRVVAARYGVTPGSVGHIWHGRTWKHIARPI